MRRRDRKERAERLVAALDEICAVIAVDHVLRKRLTDAKDDGPRFAALIREAYARRERARQN
jgi:hypothetical protein